MYCVGGGATILFFLSVAGWLAGAADPAPSVVISSAGSFPETDLFALAAYPELRVSMVLVLLNAGSSVMLSRGPPLLCGGATLDAACLSAFSFFFPSFDCSPGHSAETFSSHLLWQV